MAEYLGGIKDPDIDVVGISTAFLSSDFYVEYYDYSGDDYGRKELSIFNSIIRYEEVTSEKHKSSSYSLTWGLTGYLTGGPLWGIVGAILGGDSEETERHVVLCELNNGWQFAIELDKDEFKSWVYVMDDGIIELNKSETVK
jgi:hypothetical protein